MNAAVNHVELDAAALDQEADRLLGGAPQDPLAAAAPADPSIDPATGNPVVMASEWKEITPGIVQAIDILLIPQWGVTKQEQASLSDALADVLDQAFPGGIGDERYAPYIRLALVSFGIAMVRRDPKTGRLPPFGAKKEPVIEAPKQPAPTTQQPQFKNASANGPTN